jgi:hypothetical protein
MTAARRRRGRDRPRRPEPRRRAVRVVGWTLGALLLAAVALAALFAVQGYSAYRHLKAAEARIPQLREQVVAGDEAAARKTAAALQEDVAEARDAVHGPHWSVAAKLPVVGPDVVAVQQVTEALDRVATGAVGRAVDVMESVDLARLGPVRGRLNLKPLQQAAPDVVAAHEAVQDAAARVAGIDTRPLLDRVAAPITDLAGRLDQLEEATGTAATAAQLIPPMLGANGPRDYLLLVQNSAEPRALGGLAGAVIQLRADHGKVTLLRQSPSFTLPEPALPLTPAERALFGEQLGVFAGNVTSTPDFPRAGELARAPWVEQFGVRVDGVAAIDPVVLQRLLEATGPVRLPSGQRLTGDNTARLLLNQVYKDLLDPEAQDAYFARAAEAIFGKVMQRGGELRSIAQALTASAHQDRVLLWSAHEKEQALLAGTPLSGALRGKHEGSPVVGVYLHDRTGAKIGYYQDLVVEVTASDCEPDGARVLRVEATLTSQVPDNVEQLPDYITGAGVRVPVGDIRTAVLLYAPAGGVITDVRSGGRPVTPQFHDGLHVVRQTVVLEPGESVTLRFRIDSRAALPGDTQVRTTPGPAPQKFTAATFGCR